MFWSLEQVHFKLMIVPYHLEITGKHQTRITESAALIPEIISLLSPMFKSITPIFIYLIDYSNFDVGIFEEQGVVVFTAARAPYN